MEINAEINKVFGAEMAKLFAAQISEEEMLQTAKKVWADMQHEEGPSWDRTTSDAAKAIQSALKVKLVEQVEALTATDKFQQECRALAEDMVREIQDVTHCKVVEEVSSRLAGMSVGGQGIGLKGMIEEIMLGAINRY